MNVKIPRKWAVLLFLLAIVPRLLYLASIPCEAVLESVDAKGYDLIARNLLVGNGFSRQDAQPYQPDGLRMPLYPTFIAAIYTLSDWIFAEPVEATAVAVTQALLDGLTAVIVANLAGLFLGQRWGFAAGFMYALTPVQWRYSAALLPEVPLAFLVALALWCLVLLGEKTQQLGPSVSTGMGVRTLAVGCGVVCGLIALCKPNLAGVVLICSGAALVPAMLPPTRTVRGPSTSMLFRRYMPGLANGAIITFTAAMVIGPWFIRNWVAFGRPFLSNAAWGFVARVSAPATLGMVHDRQVPPWSPEWESRYHSIVEQTATLHNWRSRLGDETTPKETDIRERQIARFAWGIVTSHPLHALRAHLLGFARSWAPMEQSFWYAHLRGRPWEHTGVAAQSYRDAVEILLHGRPLESIEVAFVNPWKRLDALGRLLWVCWGVAHTAGIALLCVGLWRMRNSPALVLAILMTILYATFPPGPIGYVRFRVAVMPLVVVLLASGIAWLGSAPGLLPVRRPRRGPSAK